MDLLVAYDGSQVSKRAIDVAKKCALMFHAKLHVLSSTPYGPELETKEYADAKTELEQVGKSLENDGIDHEIHLIQRSLSPGEDLVDFAHRKSVDMIIMGIKKRSRVGKFFMGSTSQYVILEADCPVLAVK